MQTVLSLVLLRCLLSKWVPSALIFWTSPMLYHYSNKFHFCLGPCWGSLESALISHFWWKGIWLWHFSSHPKTRFGALFQPLYPSHGFEYVLQCLDIEDDLLYRRGPLLIEWPLGIFPMRTSKQAPEVWHAFRTEALLSLSRLLSISTSEVLRLLTDVTTIACLSQTPPLPLPLANYMPGPTSLSTPHTSSASLITALPCPMQLVLQDYPYVSSRDLFNYQ